MNRASPQDINQAMKAVQILLDAGVNFVPIAVTSPDNHKMLIAQGSQAIETLIVQADLEEEQQNVKR